MSWEDLPWFRRRRRYPPYAFFPDFEDIDTMMKELERAVDDMLKEFGQRMPEGLIRERKLPDGRVISEGGPFIYGYSITIGPDKKPVIREFGNLRPTRPTRPWEPSLELREEREPLVDVFEEEKEVKVVAELPGIDRNDIELHATENSLTISVDTEERRYFKELELPVEVEPSSAKSSYRNGVLEVTLAKKAVDRRARGFRIRVE